MQTILLSQLNKVDKLKIPTYENPQGEMFTFDHLDGMYSYITADERKEGVIHLSRVTPLVKVGDYYEIAPETQSDEQ